MSKRSSDEHGPARVGATAAAAGTPHFAPAPAPDADATHELEAESIGRYLSQQRRLRGISIEQLAESTRIPRRSLERLESGHFDHDVDGFVRGFVRTVAAGLGLDPDETLIRMLAEPRVHPGARRPIQIPIWLGRGLVGFVAILLVVMAFGVVRVVWQTGVPVEQSATGAGLVWRSDPVRALAEAHAAGPARPEAPPAARIVEAPRREPATE